MVVGTFSAKKLVVVAGAWTNRVLVVILGTGSPLRAPRNR